MGTTRRRLLRAGCTVLIPGLLAGCSRTRPGGGTPTPEQSYLDEYRSVLSTELDVTIHRLSVTDGTVRLEYTSTFGHDTGEMGYEVGFVSGRFGRLVADGWSVNQLSVRATGADGTTLVWTVSAGTARAFATDEITTDEFIDRIFDTLRVE